MWQIELSSMSHSLQAFQSHEGWGFELHRVNLTLLLLLPSVICFKVK